MIVISFILDFIINNLINYNSYFLPVFPLLTLIFLKKENNIKFFTICTLIGLIYDIIYSYNYIFNFILFLLVGFIIFKVNLKIKNRYIYYVTSFLISILLYNLFYYLIYADYTTLNLFYALSHYLIINFAFTMFFIIFISIKNKSTT